MTHIEIDSTLAFILIALASAIIAAEILFLFRKFDRFTQKRLVELGENRAKKRQRTSEHGLVTASEPVRRSGSVHPAAFDNLVKTNKARRMIPVPKYRTYRNQPWWR